MRYSKFGDAYCHTADEAKAVIEEKSDGAVHVSEIDPPEDNFKAAAEVRENESGETVCFIEADTVEAVRTIITAAGIEFTS